jgi:hypothetical protein
MSCSILVGPLLQSFFSEHLAQHRQVSFQTIASYRDTFRLLLQFTLDKKGIEPAVLTFEALDAPAILGFLDSLEQQRANCIRSRNVRLTAIRSFFRVVALREPSCLGIATQSPGDPNQTIRQAVGRLCNSRRSGCDSGWPRSSDLDGASGQRVTAHDVQHWRTSLRDDGPAPRADHSGTETVCASGRQGTKAKNGALVAHYGEGPAWLAGRSRPPS